VRRSKPGDRNGRMATVLHYIRSLPVRLMAYAMTVAP
jgi:hypothetical protein